MSVPRLNRVWDVCLLKGKAARETFNGAADAYLDKQQLHSAEKTYKTDSERSRVLRKYFGDIRLCRVTVEMVESYQTKRKQDGVAGRTANLEIGLSRRIMKRNKQWARLADDVSMLPEQPKEPKVLSPIEKKLLLTTAASRPEWQLAYSAAVLALNTTMRGCELKGHLDYARLVP